MTIASVADAAVKTFKATDQIVMVAIAGAESKWLDGARGDRLKDFSEIEQQRYRDFAVDGFLSFGAWQIFLGVNLPVVQAVSGLRTPADCAEWLYDAGNCAKAAQRILSEQGLSAWSTYNNGWYNESMMEASAAVTKANLDLQAAASHRYVAFSLDGNAVHLDRKDGSFDTYEITAVNVFQPWLRFEIEPR